MSTFGGVVLNNFLTSLSRNAQVTLADINIEQWKSTMKKKVKAKNLQLCNNRVLQNSILDSLVLGLGYEGSLGHLYHKVCNFCVNCKCKFCRQEASVSSVQIHAHMNIWSGRKRELRRPENKQI